MSLTDDKTMNYALPLPHPANEGVDDCLRLREALSGADAAIKTVADTAASKADAADIDAALVSVNAELAQKVDVVTMSTALHLKADTTALTAGLAQKADTSQNQTAHDALSAAIAAAEGKATWEGLTGKPETFPPSEHGHEWAEIRGTPVIASASTTQEGVILIASDEEATEGLNTTKAVTPKQLKDAVPILVDIQPLSGLDTVGIGHTNTFGLQAKSALIRGSVASFTVSVTGLAEPTVQTLPAIDGAATIQITPPEDTPAGTILTLTAIATDNSGYTSLPTTKDVTVMTAFVAAPTLTAPEANAVVSPISVMFATSAFSTVGSSDTHVASRYKLTTDAAGNTVVYDSGRTTTEKLTHTATMTTQLTPGATHYAWAQHEGTVLGKSSWSAGVRLVAASVNAPSIITPIAESQLVRTGITITTDPFAPVGLAGMHLKSRYRIRQADDGIVLYDSGEVAALTSHTVTEEQLSGLTEDACDILIDTQHLGTIGWSGWGAARAVEIIGKGTRIDGKATVIGLMTGYPSGTKDQWIAVLDAAYRGASIQCGKYGTDLTGLVNAGTGDFTHSDETITLDEAASSIVAKTRDPQTSKQNTDYLMTQNSGKDDMGIMGVPVAARCRAIAINGTTAQFPNLQTLAFVFSRRAFVDENDPTATTNTTRKLANWGFGSATGTYVWASSEKGSGSACHVSSGGSLGFGGKYGQFGVVPILEIPA